MHELFTLLFSHKEEPQVKRNFISEQDRYGDTYQSGIGINVCTDDKMLESGIGSSEVTWRGNSAPVILKILSKLEMPWMKVPIECYCLFCNYNLEHLM
jgi:hypothetical protein